MTDWSSRQIRFWNRGAEALYGWTRSEAIGAVPPVLLDARLPHPISEIDAALASTGQWEGEVVHRARDGRLRTVAARWALRRDESGRPLEILVISTDITHRKEAEAELARLAATEAALRERDQLLATVSHDLKTPLTTIRGQADILLRQIERTGTIEPQRARKGLELLRAAATRMATWIDDLLDSARLQAGRPLELHRQAMDLVALAWQAVAEHQSGTERHRLRVDTREPKIVGLWDPIRLRRVLDNLLTNAVKYSPNGGEIVVSVALVNGPEGQAAQLAVRDPGVGIPASELPHIFDRFRRGENVVGRFGGTGIGLAGASQIVREHGGRIDVESEPDHGTTVRVWLPLPGRESQDDPAAA